MANQLYDQARMLWAKGEMDWVNENFSCVLVSTASGYVFNAGHLSLASIDPAVRTFGTSGFAGVALTNKGVQTNGAIYADNVRFQTVTGSSIGAVVIYRRGTETDEINMPLVYYADTATGLPITPNGGDIIVTWSTGTNRILRL